MAIDLDPFTEIVAINFGGDVIGVLELDGYAINVALLDKNDNQVDGASNFFPIKKEDITTSGLIDTTVTKSRLLFSKILGFGNFIYIGRGLADSGVLVNNGSISFRSIDNTFGSEFMNSNFSFVDGELKSYANQRDTFLSHHGGDTIVKTIRDEGPGLVGSLFSSKVYSLTYYALKKSPPDYIDLFRVSFLVIFDDIIEKTEVIFNGNPQEPITSTASMKAYNASSYFVARAGGTVDVYLDEELKNTASPLWSGSGSMSQLHDNVKFDKHGKI